MNKAQQIEQLITEIIQEGDQDLINEAAAVLRRNRLKSLWSKPVPFYGDLFEIDDFFERIEPYADGSWDYSDGIMAYPDAISREGFTHIVYYSK